MDRVTRKMLEEKVEYLNRRLGLTEQPLRIDYYAPPGNPYAYQLYWIQYGTHAEHQVTNHRMTAKEFRAYLNGMIDCIEQFATAGV